MSRISPPAKKDLSTVSLEQFTPQTVKYLEAGLHGSANTALAYRGDLKRFGTWCGEHNHCPLPATIEAVAGFVASLADAGKKLATIDRHCASISKAHTLHGHRSPTDEAAIKVVMNGIRRVHGVRQKQAPAFTLQTLKRAVQAIDSSTVAGARDKVILLLGFTGGFRRSELTALDINDLRFNGDELIVNLNRSKTNQLGDSEEKAIFPSADPMACPIAAIHNWLKVLRRKKGPLLVSLRKNGALSERRLSDKHLNLIVQRHLGPQYSALSLRASFVTVSKLNGAEDSEIMNQTKHRTTGMIRRYTRLDDVRSHNAGKKLGL
jgi:site-specific recombinase XerD